MKLSKTFLVISLLGAGMTLLSRCMQEKGSEDDPRGTEYAGTDACAGCHKNVFDNYTNSNHFKTSAIINTDSLRKQITTSNNSFYYSDSSMVRLEEKDHSFYQTSYTNRKEVLSNKFDIVFGSGEKAQTYAYWKEGKLFQLPLTYFAGIHTWANSPGFPSWRARFDRVIEARCFECHSSFIKKENVQSAALKVEEKLYGNSIVYGIDCERCHGPASEHVQFHKDHPGDKKARYISNISMLTRQQQLDVCATCHAGNDLSTMRSVFDFRPGDTLANFYFPEFGARPAEPDVHGKQMQLLQSSRCFRGSEMTCSTCHDAHSSGKTMESFVSKCMNCHKSSTHAISMLEDGKQAGTGIASKRCIDCHMPLQPSKTIWFNSSKGLQDIPYLLRTHRIAIYKDTVRKQL